MHRTRVLCAAALMAGTTGITMESASFHSAVAAGEEHRYVVIAASSERFNLLRSEALRRGAEIHDLHSTTTMAIGATASQVAALKATDPSAVVVRDHVMRLGGPESRISPDRALSRATARIVRVPDRDASSARPAPDPSVRPVSSAKPGSSLSPSPGSSARQAHGTAASDPAASLPGLMWNIDRIRSSGAGNGSHDVTIAVADTGLDATHAELQGQVSQVVDFTQQEDPPLCKELYGFGDSDLSAHFAGPANGDWNGHGTWIGGNIAAALDGAGMSGIAPNVNLVSLKISQWCGAAYDSELLAAFEYAGLAGIDVLSISFGGYLDRDDADQEQLYQAYEDAVARAADRGTLIVGSAGNDHVRIGRNGRVLSHGSLTSPGDTLVDLHGLWDVPAGLPGVMTVAATGNTVAEPSADCGESTGPAQDSDGTCKPEADAHQARGIGQRDQLAYYSNYGPGIDIAAPGGARKFNLPLWDRGGTLGWPVTSADGYQAFGAFSITSNWATQMPCYLITGGGFGPDNCYTSVQGTSMATPHVSAAAALVASARPRLRHHPVAIAKALTRTARTPWGNETGSLSARDTSAADLTGTPCPSGYCHLTKKAISDEDAYGAGILDVRQAVRER